MSYKIIMDSCGEMTEEMKSSEIYKSVPLQITIGNSFITDDETFNQSEFLNKVLQSTECPKSACPSPAAFIREYDCNADRIYVITLSGALSGSYNSAVLAKNIYTGDDISKKIHVFNSCSASAGETLIALKISECEEAGLNFEETIENVNCYIEKHNIFFVLQDLDMLHKSGRISGIKSLAAKALHIVPILAGTKDGVICQLSQVRGIKNAMNKMLQLIIEALENCTDKTMIITHCNNFEQALSLKDSILKHINLKDVLILSTGGISSMYAGNGGIIVAF